MHSVRFWKVEGVFVSPKGMTLNTKGPLVVENTVFYLSLGSTCQYLEVRSSVVNSFEPARDSRVEYILGREHASLWVTE